MLNRLANSARDILGNIFYPAVLNYVVESREWSIYQDGKYITENIKSISSRLTTSSYGLRNSLIHFGSAYTYDFPHLSNKVVVSCMHIAPNDTNIERLRSTWKHIDIIHVPCDITRNGLIELGASGEKVVKISLGVDLSMFKPCSEEEKIRLRVQFGIPSGAKIIGSFQKDGQGWNDGSEPKYVKAPDVLVDVLHAMNFESPEKIFVLLSGPSRGYVIKHLEKNGIPYKYIGLTDYKNLPTLYNMLDLYLVTSRIEGAPKAILESMASGVPIVSTACGMAPEVIINGKNGFITDVDDRNALLDKSSQVLEGNGNIENMIKQGIETAKAYSWEIIAERYYKEIYSKLMEENGCIY